MTNKFDGLGEFPKEHHIALKADSVPHIQPPRRVPQTLYERLRLKLEQLDKQGVIKKVDEPKLSKAMVIGGSV